VVSVLAKADPRVSHTVDAPHAGIAEMPRSQGRERDRTYLCMAKAVAP
jgi:hypothetical protein